MIVTLFEWYAVLASFVWCAEWLAYHYHTANLRHLIITSDPHSRTSPSKILDRWKDRINIQEWNETDFLPSNFEDQVKKNSYDGKELKVLQNHRVRQANFNLKCLKELKRQNRGWTLLIDTDEYLIPREEPDKNLTKAVTPIVSDVLGALHIPAGFDKIYSPCIPINRQQFSTGKSSDEKVQAMVAPGFDGMDFQSLRWRKYGAGELEWIQTKLDANCGIVRDIPNKVIIDLGRATLEELSSDKHSGNPHFPLDICEENVYSNLGQTPFVLHHYMGTPEQWFYRSNDKRGKQATAWLLTIVPTNANAMDGGQSSKQHCPFSHHRGPPLDRNNRCRISESQVRGYERTIRGK